MAAKCSVLARIRGRLRADFIAGLFFVLPLGITIAALVWVWGILDEPLAKVFGLSTKAGFGPLDRLLQAAQGHAASDFLADVMIPFLGLCVLILTILFLGMLVRSILGRHLLWVFENLLRRLPVAGVLYGAIKQLLEAFLSSSGTERFRNAVLVQFPIEGSWVIGFLTGSACQPLSDAMKRTLIGKTGAEEQPAPEIVTIFVPTTPLPTQGFTLILPRSATKDLNLSVQEAIKLVISGGIATEGSGCSARAKALPKAEEA